jgi:hypothetical protein
VLFGASVFQNDFIAYRDEYSLRQPMACIPKKRFFAKLISSFDSPLGLTPGRLGPTTHR